MRDYKDLIGHIVQIVPNVIGTPQSLLILVRSVERFAETDIILGRFVVPIHDRAILPPEIFPHGLDGYSLAGDFRTHAKAISHFKGIDAPNGCCLYDPMEISRYVEAWRDARTSTPLTLRSGCGTLIAGGLIALGSAVTGLVLSAAKLPPPPRESDDHKQATIELVQR